MTAAKRMGTPFERVERLRKQRDAAERNETRARERRERLQAEIDALVKHARTVIESEG